jgi:hypothetical protein
MMLFFQHQLPVHISTFNTTTASSVPILFEEELAKVWSNAEGERKEKKMASSFMPLTLTSLFRRIWRY